MITITRVKQATSEFIKVLRWGKNDVRTAEQYLPHGIDSKPVKDILALYANTGERGEPVIIGYIARSEQTGEGETRIYATDTNGEEVFSLYLKGDGTVEFGGSVDNLMRFTNTKAVIEELQQSITTLKQAFASWVVVPTDGGAALKAITATWAATTLTGDIDESKIDEIKTL
jgi:hypothetical protein